MASIFSGAAVRIISSFLSISFTLPSSFFPFCFFFDLALVLFALAFALELLAGVALDVDEAAVSGRTLGA